MDSVTCPVVQWDSKLGTLANLDRNCSGSRPAARVLLAMRIA